MYVLPKNCPCCGKKLDNKKDKIEWDDFYSLYSRVQKLKELLRDNLLFLPSFISCKNKLEAEIINSLSEERRIAFINVLESINNGTDIETLRVSLEEKVDNIKIYTDKI